MAWQQTYCDLCEFEIPFYEYLLPVSHKFKQRNMYVIVFNFMFECLKNIGDEMWIKMLNSSFQFHVWMFENIGDEKLELSTQIP